VRQGGEDSEGCALALEEENIEARPMWPPACKAYDSERNRCIFNLSFRLKGLRPKAQGLRLSQTHKDIGRERLEEK